MTLEYMRPRLFVCAGWLIRKVGLFYKQKIELDRVIQITAHNKDAVTHEEIVVSLSSNDGRVLFISEFDRGFEDVLSFLYKKFIGMKPYEGLILGKPFEGGGKILWERLKVE